VTGAHDEAAAEDAMRTQKVHFLLVAGGDHAKRLVADLLQVAFQCRHRVAAYAAARGIVQQGVQVGEADQA